MNRNNYCIVSGVFFALVALAHLIRVIEGMTVQVEEFLIPMWVSWIATVVPGALAFWGIRSARQAD